MALVPLLLTLANTDMRRVVSAWPAGHVAGRSASAIGRRCSKVAPQARHRNSYVAIVGSLGPGAPGHRTRDLTGWAMGVRAPDDAAPRRYRAAMSAPQVEIASGRVEGAPSRGVLRFKGIPYAAPPVGDRRFAPPEPVEPWTGVLQATGRPPTAPQPIAAMEALAGVANLPPQSEADCLTLNVWTESLSGSRPVMVWIHGGAFVTGTGSTPWYDGVNLAKRGVVVVTINYRRGALGVLPLEPLG